MNRTIRWTGIALAGLCILFILALLILPSFISVQTYKPYIERQISEATGRPTTVEGDMNLSLFPWVGFSFGDLHLGSAPGFKEKDLLVVKSFEVRVKLLPLLKREVQVKRFVVDGPRLVLVKNAEGRGNWEGAGKKKAPEPGDVPLPEGESGPSQALPIQSLAVSEFTIENGSILWIDDSEGEQREITGLSLRLSEVSFDRPIGLVLSAKLDGKPISLEGKVGPVGKAPGTGTIPLDLSLTAFDEIRVQANGNVTDALIHPRYDIEVQGGPFSPRKVLESLKYPFPLKTTDPNALSHAAFTVGLKGSQKRISIPAGRIDLDGSKLEFSVEMKDLSTPDVLFSLAVDRLDLDRYLPPASAEEGEGGREEVHVPPAQGKTDYTPLRKIALEGTVDVGELTFHKAKSRDIHLKLAGKNGMFRMDPLRVKLYGGDLSATGKLDVRKEVPQIELVLKGTKIDSGPFLRDFLEKDWVEGQLGMDLTLSAAGDDAPKFTQTLSGKGDLLFQDGALKGIDIPGMVRNVQAAFVRKDGQEEQERPRTDFAELHVPFTLENGLFKTRETKLLSPLLRLHAAGQADLVKEEIDFRIEPTLVATLKGQGDQTERTGITVPILATGPFSSPQFRPDFKPDIKGILEDPEKLKEDSKEIREQFKGLLKGLGK
jgi:AsmA protein